MAGQSKPRERAARTALFAGALALMAALSGCIGYQGDFARGYQVDEETLAQIKVGTTTKPQALSILGTPSTTSTVGGDAWYYIGQKMHRSLAFMPVQTSDQNVLAIYFDKGGRVSRIANYGMKDGKVFDFISRTTPTGGQEPDFLRNIMTGLFHF
ncbi:MAG: outer membrane protein assembly factor BamE [Hyphomicrobiales bacterium]|nr:outer membrane protein assembly factor BamE [Hyphomicrobiales bacterium]